MSSPLELIDLSVTVLTPGGVMLELEDPDNGYEVHADSFATSAITHRKTEVNNRWIEGTYAVSTVRDNAQEALVVWVEGTTMYDYRSKMETLKACFDQATFTVVKTIGNAVETWDCEVSDYTEESQQEFIFRTMGDLRVQLNRRPQVQLTQITTEVLPQTWWAAMVVGNELGLTPIGPFAVGTPARPLAYALKDFLP